MDFNFVQVIALIIFQFNCSAWLQLQHAHHLVALLALQRAIFWIAFLINHICMLKSKAS